MNAQCVIAVLYKVSYVVVVVVFFFVMPGNRFREQQKAFVMWREVLDAEDLQKPSMPLTMKKTVNETIN